MIIDTVTPAQIYFSEHGETAREELTTVSCEKFEDDLVGFHINPYTDETITVMLTPDDAWRFIKEMAIVASSAELSS